MMKKLLSAALIAVLLLASACAPHEVQADTSKPYVSVSFDYADGLKYPPSYAVWVQDEAGNTDTLFATAKVATGLKNRPGALPVWSGVRDADVTSGATTQKKAALTLNIPDAFAGQKLTLFIEANASYDYNNYYAEGLKEGEEGYNDVNGQPSAVYSAAIDMTAASGSASPTLAGAGDVLGADHSLHDADHLTTPAIRNIAVEWSQGKG
jgi:hypothetical protein